MPRITGAKVVTSDGRAVKAECFGNNAAIICPCCNEHPIVLIARPYQLGSSASNPAVCECGVTMWIDVIDPRNENLYLSAAIPIQKQRSTIIMVGEI